LTKEAPLINFVHGRELHAPAENFPRRMDIMKTSIFLLILCAFSFSGCAVMCTPPRINTSAKTDVALLKYKKIAVISFQNGQNKPTGQEAADILALGFVKKGFNVMGNNEIAALINQDEVYRSGLTPEIKSRLKSAGIDGIVTGTIHEQFCSQPASGLLLFKEREKTHCAVNIETGLLDLDSGEIIWGVTASDMEEGKWVTADSVVRTIMWHVQEKIPDIVQLKQIGKPAAGKQ
jgi:hypothetical protein